VDGKGSAARFSLADGIAANGAGTVYVADNVKVRKVTPDGMVTTLAGSWPGGHADGAGSQAKFGQLSGGIAVDRDGTIYVADAHNYLIRKVTADGVVTTLAGAPREPGDADGPGSAARFRYPTALEVDLNGNLLVIDEGRKIRMVTPQGMVTTLPLQNQNSGFFDWQHGLRAIAADGGGNLYLTDSYNSAIHKVTPDWTVTTLAGHGNHAGSADGTGTDARFNWPSAITVDHAGNL
jgi:sugar lactone lactonase YvrE